MRNELMGFSVYYAESGEPALTPFDETFKLQGTDDDFVIDQNGNLYAVIGSWGKRGYKEVEKLDKTGKYIIQFDNGEMLNY